MLYFEGVALMFDFFDEIIKFINQFIGSQAPNPVFQQLHQLINNLMAWLRNLSYSPIGFTWILPVCFFALWRDWLRGR